MKFDGVVASFDFARKSYFACPYRPASKLGLCFISLRRSTLCEFSKTKFVHIGKCLTDWQLSKVAQNQHFL